MMDFRDLLSGAGLNLRQVAVMLHQPSIPGQRAALASLVVDAPELFERYQDNHPRIAEATIKARPYAASFVVDDAGEARFVGLYKVLGWTERSVAQLRADPVRQKLMAHLGGAGVPGDEQASEGAGRAVFDLSRLDALASLKGRLVVPRPAGRAYVRLAENCVLPIIRVDQTAHFVPSLPSWDRLVLTADQIRHLPLSWADRLSQWRGVYHILDTRDGARYVGSAYGADNVLGRWRAHVAGEKGVTVELAHRDPATFVFSILELVAPSADMDEVLGREASWKERLGTRTWGLNKN